MLAVVVVVVVMVVVVVVVVVDYSVGCLSLVEIDFVYRGYYFLCLWHN